MKKETIIILPRTEPDLDGVACAIAYAEFLKISNIAAMPWYKDEPDAEARYLINYCKGVNYASEQQVSHANEFILVDASGLEGLPSEVNPAHIIEVIDHRFHHNSQQNFPNAKLQIERVGAAATLITEKFIQMNAIPSTDSALMLYGAINSNTQELKGTITSERDINASQWLEKNASIPSDFLTKQFAARKYDLIRDLLYSITKERKDYTDVSGPYAISQLEFHGSGALLGERYQEIFDIVSALVPRTALNMVDLEANSSFILVPDEGLRLVFAKHFELKFNDGIAITDGIILRKQLVDKITGH